MDNMNQIAISKIADILSSTNLINLQVHIGKQNIIIMKDVILHWMKFCGN